jgi:long-chain acyl-CoA synthetase
VQNVASRTQPKLAFTSRVTPSHEDLSAPEVRIEELEELTEGLSSPKPVDVTAEDLAEIMFTSGTTGNPKGVMLTHGNLMSNLEAASQHVYGEATDRLISILPLSHMFEQMGGLLLALRAGANVTYPASRQPTILFRTMKERRVTLMLLVPQALELFMKGIEREVRRQGKEKIWQFSLRLAARTPFPLRRLIFRKVHQGFGGRLRLIFSGGAALDPELAAKWELLGIRIVQGYGATEASPVISIHMMDDPRYDSVGLPVPGLDVRISEGGEVLLRGPSITPGYWQAPEETEKSFEDGWYKTGDQGFFDDGGFLHLRGRKKDMIVLSSGQNVFPEDIEAVVKKHPDVADVAVVGLPRGSDTEVHAAFLMDDPEKAVEVVSWANAQLAEHQQVRGFTVWPDEDFPRTHTLKVKKRVMEEVLQGIEPASPAAVQPSQKAPAGAEVEGLIAEVGAVSRGEVTPDKALGTDLGLDSLRRVELLSAIEGDLGVYLDENQVSEGTTVAELKAMVEQGSGEASAMTFPQWGMSWWCRMARGALQRAFAFPLSAGLYRLRVSGQENLNGVRGPVLFAANHNLGLDNPLIIKAIPQRWRRRMAIAASAHLWRNPVYSVMNPLLGNGFPFSKEGAVRPSLENLGRLMDRGWSVLIYPEGDLTVGGPMKPFLGGVGLIAVEGRVPVVPLRLVINKMGSPQKLPLLRRGDVEVRFGQPLAFAPGHPYEDATAAIEQAVKAL